MIVCQKIKTKENNKILLKETKDTNKSKDIPYSWTGKLNIVKMVKFPQIDLQIQHDPYQNPKLHFLKKLTS